MNDLMSGLTIKYKETKIYTSPAIEKLMKHIDKLPPTILLHGDHGGGKTFAEQYFLNACAEKYKKPCLYITLSNLMMVMYEMEWKEKIEYLERCINEWFVLGIDEIDKVKLTEWKEEIIFNLLDNRMSKVKHTIMSSNLDTNELAESLGDNIMSRVLNGVVLNVKGEVLR